jgi:hypothetical protein
VDFDVTDQVLIRYPSTLERNWEYSEKLSLFIDLEKACDSVKQEVLYNILIKLVYL